MLAVRNEAFQRSKVSCFLVILERCHLQCRKPSPTSKPAGPTESIAPMTTCTARRPSFLQTAVRGRLGASAQRVEPFRGRPGTGNPRAWNLYTRRYEAHKAVRSSPCTSWLRCTFRQAFQNAKLHSPLSIPGSSLSSGLRKKKHRTTRRKMCNAGPHTPMTHGPWLSVPPGTFPSKRGKLGFN